MSPSFQNPAADRARRVLMAMAISLAVVMVSERCAAPVSAADWKPEKPIELIVGTGPGSGVDNTARTLQAIMLTHKLIETPLTITNKPGGSYGVALNYLGQFSGDGHRIFIQTSTPLSALLTGQLNVKYFEFTPIANLISEPIAFMVRGDSPITSGKDLAQRLKADPASVSIALAAARGNAYHIASALIAKAVGADIRKLKIVVFNSSAEAMAALLGGHVDVLAATPGAFLPLLEARKIRIAGVASRQRLSGPLTAVPTLKEQGLNVVFDVPRSIMGPKGLSADQIRYWDDVFARLIKTPSWKDAVAKNQWDEDYMNSAELGKNLKAQYEILKDVLTELGMVTH
ncbi:MAG TPA: tripartite tricarboxylate transporter substrate binding protein [Burkholderiales bacterium]|nr:tripartite tricarboxylate transporter substrate binding protein [Burkholderiales bacterium]